MRPLEQAIENLGSQSALARACGVKQGHVWAWLNRDGYQVPAEHCPAIEQATGVKADDLRPDMRWIRDKAGRITGYMTPVSSAQTKEAA